MTQIIDPEKDAFIANVLYQEGIEDFHFNLQAYYNLLKPSFKLTNQDKKRYCTLYGWPNEVISRYYNYKDLTNKRALCVTSSGAHTIHASLAGATKIDSFDINPLTKWYSALQIALIKTYDLKSYMNQFDSCEIIKNISSYKLLCIKNNIDLSELSNHLTDEEKRFWNLFLKNKFKKTINLFRTDGYLLPIEENCAYFNEEIFNKAKERLNKASINYYDLDITNPKERQVLSSYSAVFLSNIAEYYVDDKTRSPKDILQTCGNLLDEDGVLYDYNCIYNPNKNTVPGLKHKDTILCTYDLPYIGNLTGVNVYKKER